MHQLQAKHSHVVNNISAFYLVHCARSIAFILPNSALRISYGLIGVKAEQSEQSVAAN